MSKIRILSEDLANQIAAGEVVERPASVVKECVENSIDAGAQHVLVQVEGSGSSLIRVIDDGEGMDQDDILLCLERHATSKLQSAEQLAAILSLGFRGEAIPSIASVSRLAITSRVRGAELGNRLEVRYGQVRKIHEMGCAFGTVIEIRDLFGNVPARKKFLKTARTELSHIEEVIINAALSCPHIGFSLRAHDRELWSFPGQSDSLERRVRAVLKPPDGTTLLHVRGQTAEDRLSMNGFLMPPDMPTGTAARLRIFVNSRAVRDRMVSHAVSEGLQGFLMKGRRPTGVIFLQLDPESVDVNVHPTKQEVRFRQSQWVHGQIVRLVKEEVTRFQSSLKHALFGVAAGSEGKGSIVKNGDHQSELHDLPDIPVVPKTVEVREPKPRFAADSVVPRHLPEAVKPGGPSVSPPPARGHDPEEALFVLKKDEPQPGRLRYVGQFLDSYLICESAAGVVMIDQHAAHERLIFEEIKKKYEQLAVPSQQLLFPEMIELTSSQAEILEEYGSEMKKLGLHLEEFGGESYVIKAVPAILGHLGPIEVVHSVFNQYLSFDRKGQKDATRIDDVLAVMACKAAVKAHDHLQHAEGVALVRKMEDADVFSHCPHGRPVFKVFSENDVQKWFHR